MNSNFSQLISIHRWVWLVLFATCAAAVSLSVNSQTRMVQDDPGRVTDVTNDFNRLAREWEQSNIYSIDIFHISTNAEFVANMSSSRLEGYYDFKLTITDATESKLAAETIQVVTNITAALSKRVSDVRWGCVFYTRANTRVMAVYFDRTGRRGVINGACVDFGSDDLRKWAETNLGHVFR